MLTLGVWRRLLLGVGAAAITTAAALQFGADGRPRASSSSNAPGDVAVGARADRPLVRQATPAQAKLPAPPPTTPPPVSEAAQREFLLESARSAWAYVRRNYHPSTGFVGATDAYQFVTMWDVGSILGAYLAARELGFITPDDYRSRVSRVLRSLGSARLHDGAAFNRLYAAASGQMVGRDHRATTRGYGWSATDLGRLLVWLKIVATHDPEHEAAARRIVARLDLDRIVRAGYLRGEELTPRGRRRLFQEGRIGYEQYAAAGFALWDIRADSALDLHVNSTPLTILGHMVLADRRGDDLLTSEPVVMLGLELGWPSADLERLARGVLGAQEERHRQTGVVTIVSEDAVPRPPAYFYYYLLHHNGQDFVVVTPSHDLVPWNLRWVSAKAAFAWHALFPSAYTWLALQTVKGAESRNVGWSAGVYERSKVRVASNNLNTAAVILESAAYAARGCPLIVRQANCPGASGGSGGSGGVKEGEGLSR
ncbi:MAG: DUF3131 domain-containing protein [Gemmatimonadota bacterium]|nr:DUF3131 domain-containing protein [Gemmatimonadota bacterium]